MRFAYTIFPQVRGFLQLDIDRDLLSISLAKKYGKVYTASPDECKDSYHKQAENPESRAPPNELIKIQSQSMNKTHKLRSSGCGSIESLQEMRNNF